MIQREPAFPQLARYGAVAAGILIILTLAWIFSLALAPMPGAEATAEERIRFLADNDGWQFLTFAIVAPMGIIHVPVWIGLAALIQDRRPALAALTLAFGFLYAPFTVLGYWSQLTTTRGLVDLYDVNPESALAALEVIEFTGNLWSLSYGIVVLGYGVWGLAALAVFAGMFGFPYRLARVCAGLFGLSGAFGVIGAIGFAARNEYLELGVIFSGIVFLPSLIGTAVLLYQAAEGRLDSLSSSDGSGNDAGGDSD